MSTQQIDSYDSQWGSYIPWFLRSSDFTTIGNFLLFFERLSQRLDRLFTYNEPGISNLLHFGDLLETKSFQHFRFDRTKPLNTQIKVYFSPDALRREHSEKINQDQDVKNAIKKRLEMKHTFKGIVFSGGKKDLQEVQQIVKNAELQIETVKKSKIDFYYVPLFNQRISVLEVLLRILPQSNWVNDLLVDIRRFFTESEISLEIKGVPPLIVPMEEPLLQREVLDNLLPRLSKKFPERAKELIDCYHRVKTGKDLDSIFSEAFKSLEEITRSITGNNKFVFDKANLKKYFPLLHSTIHETIIKLAGHRGDKAGHGKASPYLHEIRYLLFSVCNIALLLLKYPTAKNAEGR